MTLTPKIRIRCCALALLLVLALPALAPAGSGPTPTALPPLAGDTDSIAVGVNNGGDVVGNSMGATNTGVVWDRHGNATMILPLPGDVDSFAQEINNGGDVVGYSRNRTPPCGAGDTAVKWDRHGVTTTLRPLPGDLEARANGINSQGVAVGISLSPRRPDCTAAFTAVRWDTQGNPTALVSPSAALPEGFANGITRNGDVSGFVNDAAGTVFRAAIWDEHGVPTLLPGHPGSIIDAAFGIAENGVVVGPAMDGFFAHTALLWDRKGNPPVVLTPLGADPEAYAISNNARGDVAGVSGVFLFAALFGIFDPPATAVVWDKHGNPTPLPPLPGDAFSYAGGINEAGAVAGFSHDPGTDTDTAVVWR